MGVFKRKTSAGETREYHYKFSVGGMTFRGVCEGCFDKRSSEAFEKGLKDAAKMAAKAKTIAKVQEAFVDIVEPSAKVSLSDAYDHASVLVKAGRSEVVHQQKRQWWMEFAGWMAENFPGVADVGAVTADHAKGFIGYVRDQPLSVRTKNGKQQAVKAVFRELLSGATPFDAIKPLKKSSEPRKAFTVQQVEDIIAAADPLTRPLFILGAWTGLRLGDICRLKWDSVDFEDDYINVRTGKTATEVSVPMLPAVREGLADIRARARDGQEYVFPEAVRIIENNKDGMTYRVKAVIAAAGVRSIEKVEGRKRSASVLDFHSLRHFFAAEAVKKGLPISVVQSVLGHASEVMTRHYSNHASKEDKRAAFRKLGGGGDDLRQRILDAVRALPENKLAKVAGAAGVKINP